MALGLSKTKRRIASVKSTQKITKAMEMVATVKLKRFRREHDNGELYLRAYEDLMAELFLQKECQSSHYGKPNEDVEGCLYIVVTSDLGLCAAYNSNVYRFVDEHVDLGKDTIVPIGEKGIAHFTHDPKYVHVLPNSLPLTLTPSQDDIIKTARELKKLFNERKYQRIYLIHTQYLNSLSFEPHRFQLLPVQLNYQYKPHPSEAYCPPLCEPSPKAMVHALMDEYLTAVIRGKLNESELSEQASRRNAMDAANDNAEDLISSLTIEYNKARQQAITQEITEVVSGANGAK